MLTLPNLVSFLRLLGVPALLWLGIEAKSLGWLLFIFAFSGVSDYLDGYLARRLNQYSELGARLDPLADRLYTLAALFVLVWNSWLPIWVAMVLIARDLFMSVILIWMRQDGYAPPQVHYVGKAGTMMLLYAIPLLLVGELDFSLAETFRYFSLGFLGWAICTYWYAGFLYVRQFLQAKVNNVER